MENITPEYVEALKHVNALDKLTVTREDLNNTREKLSTSQKPDLVCLGCPHSSLEEIKEVANELEGKQLANQLWICTSISIKAAADRMGYTQTIENAGGHVVCDTCMVVAPIEDMGFKVIGVNSAKAANYVPSMCGLDVVFDEWENLIAIKKPDRSKYFYF